ncbi:MAG: DNA gyrase subunit A [Solirubrobacteraceae bacterium]|nr:DNA gyrase subunit A [Patulibacter sp.]
MTTPTTAPTLPDVRDGLTTIERITVRAVASARGDEHTRSSRTVAQATRREPHYPAAELYATLTRLAQPWNTPYPLIDGSGDFGTAEGAPAAGATVTHAALSAAGQALIDELELPEDDPGQRLHLKASGQVLPGPFPHLLANGSTVGDSTFLPHHVGEVAAAITHRLQHPTSTLADIRALVHGPEFATPAAVVDPAQLDAIYETGRGSLRIRPDGDTDEITIDVDATAMVDGRPKQLSLLDQIDEYLEHRRSVLRRKHRKHESALDKIIAHDLSELAEQFAADRRTTISGGSPA